MWMSFLSAAAAALSAAAGPHAGREVEAQEAERSSDAANAFLAVAAAAAIAASEDSDFDGAQPALEIRPLQFIPWRQAPHEAGAPDFRFGGLGVSLAAFRPKFQSDPLATSAVRGDQRAMGKMMPGYPQPARLVVGVKVSF